MKKLLISQHTGTSISGAKISFLDKDYIKLFREYVLIPVPNGCIVNNYLDIADGVVLSGGSNEIGDNIRTKTELKLISGAIARDIPVLGICRGMQLINTFYNGNIINVDNHVGKHKIMATSVFDGESISVLSHHDLGITSKELASSLKFFALSEDGVIEGLYHPKVKIIGIQWHPERQKKLTWLDDAVIDMLNKWQIGVK